MVRKLVRGVGWIRTGEDSASANDGQDEDTVTDLYAMPSTYLEFGHWWIFALTSLKE